jgi:hypothetical protein
LLRSANLSSLVQTDEPLTILAPSDEVVAAFEEREWSNLPESGTQELRDMLRYHIIKGKWTGKELSDGMLLDSSLVTGRLKGGSQKVPVSVTSEKEAKERVKKVGFGDANVLGDPSEFASACGDLAHGTSSRNRHFDDLLGLPNSGTSSRCPPNSHERPSAFDFCRSDLCRIAR